ncbi:hypothetical protein BCR42DRAFT_427211 [Absidia repens]|uniref:SWIRM domain-containing protein n=1 Tax=Absidia repens TaxID=90262 RepID=A0A1X2I032_9FUNG|nr:hypothetical protein BCR42DRAFT_427211 [Absidia repens]
MTKANKAFASGPAYHEIQGYMPKRKEFEVEYDNDAEQVIKDLSFYGDDTEQDIRLKLIMLGIYNNKLDRRAESKHFIFERHWLDFRAQRLAERKRTRKLISDTRVFCRLQTAEDYDQFIKGLVREHELRERIAQLQHWRQGGVTTFQQGEQYEQDKVDRVEYLKASLEAAHDQLQFHATVPGICANSNDMGNGIGGIGSTTTLRRLELQRVKQLQEQEQESKIAGSISAPLSSSTAAPPPVHPTLATLMSSRPLQNVPSKSKSKPPPPTGRKPANPLDISNTDGVDLLTPEEQVLCSTLRLLPRPYLVIKDTILKEYAKQGFLKRRATRALIKIDVNKTSRIYDFFIESGWITATKVSSDVK